MNLPHVPHDLGHMVTISGCLHASLERSANAEHTESSLFMHVLLVSNS